MNNQIPTFQKNKLRIHSILNLFSISPRTHTCAYIVQLLKNNRDLLVPRAKNILKTVSLSGTYQPAGQTGTNSELTDAGMIEMAAPRPSHSSILSPLFHVVVVVVVVIVDRRPVDLLICLPRTCPRVCVVREQATPTKIPPACPSIHIDESERDFSGRSVARWCRRYKLKDVSSQGWARRSDFFVQEGPRGLRSS